MKIVVTEPLYMAEEVKQSLTTLGTVVYGPFDDAALSAELADCQVLMVRLGRYLGEPLMQMTPNLRYIVTATTGVDHVDLDAAKERGVRVVSLRDCMHAIADVSATAEHSLGLLLALLRRTFPAVAHVLDGGWERNLFFGSQLQGKRLGIVGYGRIGALVAHYASALGLEVVAYDRDTRKKVTPPAEAVPLKTLLAECDVVSIHVTADRENRHLIDRDAIARMRPGAFLVNTARGSVVDEAALAEAVYSGHLAGVAVDVLEGEVRGEIAASPLLACARAGHNVLITPHIGGATYEAIERTEKAVVEVLMKLVEQEARL
jgi:D-3-phosphoglycerate dehydrogenase